MHDDDDDVDDDDVDDVDDDDDPEKLIRSSGCFSHKQISQSPSTPSWKQHGTPQKGAASWLSGVCCDFNVVSIF